MRKNVLLILVLSLLFSLAACGGKEAKRDLDPAALSGDLLKSNVFSASLEELPASKVSAFYELDADTVEEAVLYHASGVSKEQIVILKLRDETAAGNTVSELKGLITQWLEADKAYAPQEVPKLEKAVLRQSGVWVVLVISNDPDTTAKIVGEYI